MIQSLRAFAAVVAAGSFAGAAERLGLTQPEISEAVRLLETEYGLTLLERSKDRVSLTESGERLHQRAQQVLAALDDLEQDLLALRSGAGVLNVAATSIPGAEIMALVLPRFRALQPSVWIRESVGETHSVIERLLRREVEVAVAGGPLADERLEMTVLARDEFALVARRDHPLASRAAVRAAEVCRHPLVLRSEGTSARRAVEEALLRAGVERKQIQIAAELGSNEALRWAVEAGLGLAFLPYCTLGTAETLGELRPLPLADEPPARDQLVLTERGGPPTTLGARFRDFLLSDETRRLVAGYTQLPESLRPRQPDGAAPTGPTRSEPVKRPPVVYRLARLPRDGQENRVARLLAETYRGGRPALIEKLADELRRREGNPLLMAPEAGLFRLELYDEQARQIVDRLVGDLLVEVD